MIYGYLYEGVGAKTIEEQKRWLSKIDHVETDIDEFIVATDEKPFINYVEQMKSYDVVYLIDFEETYLTTEKLMLLLNKLNTKRVAYYFTQWHSYQTAMKNHYTDVNHVHDIKAIKLINKIIYSTLYETYRFERASKRKKQKKGIAEAREKGVILGRKKTVPENNIIKLYTEGVKIKHIAERLKISKASIFRILRKNNVPKRND